MQKIYSIGLHKTGSSSLQNYLLQNQIALLQSGILFPPVEPQGIARLLSEATGRRERHRPARLNEYMGHNALAYRLIADLEPDFSFPAVHEPMFSAEQALSLVAELVSQLSPEALVFCSEDLARASYRNPQIPALFAEQFGTDDTTILCTIRRPDEAISSWQCQRLNFPEAFERLQSEGIEGYLRSVHVDYAKALQPWLQTFKNAQVKIQPYKRVMTNGGAVANFWTQSGLDEPKILFLPDDRNQSLPYALFEIARLAKGDDCPAPWQVLSYLKEASARLILPSNAKVDLIGPANRKILAQAFLPIQRELAKITNCKPFYDDLEQIESGDRLDSLEAARTLLPALKLDAAKSCKNGHAKSWLQGLSDEKLIHTY